MLGLNLLSVLIELAIYYYFFYCFFGAPKFKAKKVGAVYLAVGIFSLVLSVYAPISVRRILYFVNIGVIALCYEGHLGVRLSVAAIFQTSCMMIERICSIFLAPLREALAAYGECGIGLEYFLGVLFSNLIIIVLVKWLSSFREFRALRQQGALFPHYFKILFLFPLGMLFVMDQLYVQMMKTADFSVGNLLAVLIVAGLIVSFIFFYNFLVRYQVEINQRKILLKQQEDERRYYKMIMDEHQRILSFQHEAKNQYAVLADLLKNGHYDSALALVEQQLTALADLNDIHTGRPLLDAILAAFGEQAQQAGAEYHCYIAADLQYIGMTVDDLVSLLSNTLNNALEAIRCIPEQSKRKIWCKLVQKENYLYVSVRNTVVQNVAIKDNLVKTTKYDKSIHGFGLLNVQKIMAKYRGHYILKCENNIFTFKAIFPLKFEEIL